MNLSCGDATLYLAEGQTCHNNCLIMPYCRGNSALKKERYTDRWNLIRLDIAARWINMIQSIFVIDGTCLLDGEPQYSQ